MQMECALWLVILQKEFIGNIYTYICFLGVCPKQETIPFGTVSIPSVSLNKKFPSMNGKYCVLCEYISHIAQEAVDQPSNEGNIKKVVLEICHKLPKAIKSQCGAFVKLYGDSLISLLSQVCRFSFIHKSKYWGFLVIFLF